MHRISAVFAVLVAAGAAWAEPPAASSNAALGYWRAFSAMNDPEEGRETDDLEALASGRKAWDAAALGKLVERNVTAFEELHRASLKASCDFGLDWDLGFSMLLPHLSKARQLSKLNLARARMLAAEGQPAKAVETWLDGVRMSVHLSADGILISDLVACAIFNAHADAIATFVGRGGAGPAELARLREAFAAIPPGGWDWGASVANEKRCASGLVAGCIDPSKAESPAKMLAGLINLDGASGDSSEDVLEKMGLDLETARDAKKLRAYLGDCLRDYGALMDDVAAALREPCWEALPKLEKLGARTDGKNLLTSLLAPALSPIGQRRAEMEARRALLLALVAAAEHRAQKGADLATLEGLGVPPDPFTGRPLIVVVEKDGLAIRSEGKQGGASALEVVLERP
ncbi:MAG: hypothetical protein IT452_00475 [Planctomycetia bacterium]|nr:hypothetical protein [Planctomycetia bacterium]